AGQPSLRLGTLKSLIRRAGAANLDVTHEIASKGLDFSDIQHVINYDMNDAMEEAETIANASGVKGCAYCGGLGHRIRDCQTLEHQNSVAISNSRREYIGS
ncbi:hypothetical protein EUTSA_v10005533mg, partial [Eutrema salsugineum]